MFFRRRPRRPRPTRPIDPYHDALEIYWQRLANAHRTDHPGRHHHDSR